MPPSQDVKWGKQNFRILPPKKESLTEYSLFIFIFNFCAKFRTKEKVGLIAFGNSIHFLISHLLWKNKI